MHFTFKTCACLLHEYIYALLIHLTSFHSYLSQFKFNIDLRRTKTKQKIHIYLYRIILLFEFRGQNYSEIVQFNSEVDLSIFVPLNRREKREKKTSFTHGRLDQLKLI